MSNLHLLTYLLAAAEDDTKTRVFVAATNKADIELLIDQEANKEIAGWIAARYCTDVLKERLDIFDQLIIRSPIAILHVLKNLGERKPWPEAEPVILTSPLAIFEYATLVLKRPWPKGFDALKAIADRDADGGEHGSGYWLDRYKSWERGNWTRGRSPYRAYPEAT